MSAQEKREKMLSLVAYWQQSGLTQKAFGKLHDINVATWVTGWPDPKNGNPLVEVLLKSHPDRQEKAIR